MRKGFGLGVLGVVMTLGFASFAFAQAFPTKDLSGVIQ
jgi:hypothetical protein